MTKQTTVFGVGGAGLVGLLVAFALGFSADFQVAQSEQRQDRQQAQDRSEAEQMTERGTMRLPSQEGIVQIRVVGPERVRVGDRFTYEIHVTNTSEDIGIYDVFARTEPLTDVNGSGFVEAAEVRRDENRAAMKITGTTGQVTSAEFTSPDCIAGTPETEACMYLSGALPVALGELERDCPLPGGGTAPACVPVTLSPQAMYTTSLAMHAVLSNVVPIDTNTGTAVMRIREPAGGPVMGYIVDGGGTPRLMVALELYMDAPDMSLPLTSHDLHSKPLSVSLEGPMTFLPDGRIAIATSNTADLPVEVVISSSIGEVGRVQMVVPKGEMKLQLVSAPLRGGAR